jgi:hypothetical protein
MDTPTPTSPIRGAHVAAAAVLCLMLPALRGLISSPSSALVQGGPSRASASTLPTTPAVSARPMGSLHGRGQTIELSATASGTRYSIRDDDGTLIASNLSPEEASSYLGGQDPRELLTHQGAPAIMSAEDYRAQP